MRHSALSALLLVSFAPSTMAQWSSTLTLASDYLFNGVTQTDENPALQGSLDWAGESGWYAGAWGSNVDFGDDTNLEVDIYAGYYQDLSENMSLDIGIAQYTYHGAGYSSDGNYPEAYVKWGIGNTELNFWYSWDYFGSDAGHYIVMLNHTLELNEATSLLLGVDRSTSLDAEKYEWETDKRYYYHWQATLNYSYAGFDMSLGLHGTDLDTYGDTTLLLTVGRTFTF